MIAYISGRVTGRILDQVIVKTPSGVGYLVHVPQSLKMMVNENVEIFTLHVKRDDKDELYGFTQLKDREYVDTLLKVSGVGPKVAANIIYTLGWEILQKAINEGDVDTISSVKGLGVKTAKKIVIELKDSKANISDFDYININDQSISDFTETLSGLGYKKSEIVSVISQMKKDNLWDQSDLVQMVKTGLKYLNKN